MKRMILIALVGISLLTGCSFAVSSVSSDATGTPAQTPTAIFISTQGSVQPTPTPESLTPIPGVTLTVPPPPAASTDLCADPQAITLINSLKSSMLKADGSLLSSLVSPTRGMEVRYFRDGTVITYSAEQAKFLYETTFEANWGAAPGSGEDKIGSFHDVIVPELVKIFNQPYTLHCNELKHGGATYELKWPYKQGFYSVYFPGTDANGNLDWHTWVIGIDYENNKPSIYALMQFFWEP